MGGTSDGGARIRFDRFGARQEPARVSAVAANRWAEVGREGDKDKDRRWAAAAAAATAATVALGRDRGGSAVGGGGTIPTNTTAAWSSSAGVGAGAGGAGGVVGEGGRGRGWRTEADADLSDIKATMRRIDGACTWAARGFGDVFFLLWGPYLVGSVCGRSVLVVTHSKVLVPTCI